MALARVKTWIAGEVLTASDLNAEFSNILSNPGSLITPIGFDLTFTDATYDIGKASATRPRDVFLSRNLTAGGTGQVATTFGVGGATPAASGSGVSFPASQSASSDANTLDDYEEGTFTPVLTATTAGDLAVTYSVQTGTYIKIGSLVIATVVIVTSAFTWTTSSGAMVITGLPFTVRNDTNRNWEGAMAWRGITKANFTNVVAQVVANESRSRIVACGSGQATANIAPADMPTGGTVDIEFTVAYQSVS